ncbi:MAG: leucine-rich repeat protein [Clostridiales bacterium]|nr:leucine-rich repeat protein [Clostridiales bacterium]
MKYIKKNIFIIFLCLVVSSILFGVTTNFEVNAYEINAAYDESNYNLNQDFDDDTVVITLTKEATRQFLDYEPIDFSDVEATAVIDLTRHSVDWVRKTLAEEQTQEQMLIDVEEFRRMLCIMLGEKSKENVLRVIQILQDREDVESAYPNFIIKSESVVDYSGVESYATDDMWALERINAQGAWNISEGESTVLVGVLDSGIDASHPDLKDAIYDGTAKLHRDYARSETGGLGVSVSTPTDTNGHGTMVAGIIAAKGIGRAVGVAKNIKLVSLRVTTDYGGGLLADVADAIDFAGSKSIPILNCSFSSKLSLKECEDLAGAIRKYKGLIVTIAGNDGQDIDNEKTAIYPGSFNYLNIITVGATDKKNNRGVWSSTKKSAYGAESVDLFAPGTDIVTTNKTSSTNMYISDSGTSLAAPFVTGVAALLLSHNPNLSASEIKNAILNTVTPVASLNGLCVTGGMLNAAAALESRGFKIADNGADTVKIVGTYFTPEANLYLPTRINGKIVTEIGDNAFSNASSLKNVVFWKNWEFDSLNTPCQLQSIGNYAFANSGLTSFTIPSSVTSIGYNAFDGCKNLKSINFNNCGITKINSSTFQNSGLESITIPSGVKSIDSNAFYGCQNLATINNFEACDIDTIQSGTFQNSGIESIIIPASVKTIGNYAFDGCSSLINVWFYDNSKLESIGSSAFNNSGLSSITLPSNVASIGIAAFYDCKSLHTVNLNNKLSSIDSSVFRYSGLTSISIPSSVKTINSYAFANCSALKNVVFESGSSLESIGSYAFYNSGLTNIYNTTELGVFEELPPSVKSIDSYAFASCRNLSQFVISYNFSKLESIGSYAFSNSGLKKIYFPSIDSYGSSILYGCTQLTEINFYAKPTATTALTAASSVFRNIGSSNVQLNIGRYATKYAETVVMIPSYLFSGATLKTVNFSDFHVIIDEYAFNNCTGLTDIIYSSGCALELGDFAFNGCKGVTTVKLPTVDKIGTGVFAGCSNLSSISGTSNSTYTFSNNCIIRNSDNTLLMGCNSISIPDTVKRIGDYAFSGMINIENVVLPEVTYIGYRAFYGCSNLSNAKFTNPTAFDISKTNKQSDATVTLIMFNNIALNATNLRSTYCNYYWFKA